MKEFEKFNSKRGIDHRMRFSGATQFRAYIEQEREDTWEAALGWAKREAISSDERGDISRKIINRELSGGD